MKSKETTRAIEPRFRLFCAWCRSVMGRANVENSHGICDKCYLRAMIVSKIKPDLLDELPFGVVVMETNGTVTARNSAEELVVAFGRSEIVGLNLFEDLMVGKEMSFFKTRYRSFLRSKKPILQIDYASNLDSIQIELRLVFLRVSEQQAAVAITRAVITRA